MLQDLEKTKNYGQLTYLTSNKKFITIIKRLDNDNKEEEGFMNIHSDADDVMLADLMREKIKEKVGLNNIKV